MLFFPWDHVSCLHSWVLLLNSSNRNLCFGDMLKAKKHIPPLAYVYHTWGNEPIFLTMFLTLLDEYLMLVL